MPKRLTAAAIDSATTPKSDRYIFDSVVPGFALKLTATGKRLFVLKKVYPGHTQQTRRTLGPATGDGLEAARERAKRWAVWIAQGVDPHHAEAKEREAQQAQDQHTFKLTAEGYIAERQGWQERNRRINDDAREIRNLLISEWGSKPVASFTPSDVRGLMAKLRKRSPYTARAAWSHLTLIFKWAVHEEKLAASPMASLDKKQFFKGARMSARAVILNTDEIAALWRGAGRMPYPVGDFYRLLLLSGLRKNELLQAKWSELNPKLRALLRDAAANDRRIVWSEVPDETKVLTIPPERFKSDAVHIAVLSNAACAILERVPRWKGCDFIFSHNGKRPPDEHKGKTRLDARMSRSLKALARMRGDDPEKVKLTAWTNHDLRRVVKSNMAALKVADHVSELVLGHARKGLQGIYDRHAYLEERRAALEAWAARVSAIVEPQGRAPEPALGGNVVQLRKRA